MNVQTVASVKDREDVFVLDVREQWDGGILAWEAAGYDVEQ